MSPVYQDDLDTETIESRTYTKPILYNLRIVRFIPPPLNLPEINKLKKSFSLNLCLIERKIN